jgi:hypothetical protein
VLDTPQGEDPATGVKVLFTGCDKHALPQIMETMAHFNPALVDVMLRTAIKLQFEKLDAERKAEAKVRKN